jgi:nitric oxide reductase subunit B
MRLLATLIWNQENICMGIDREIRREIEGSVRLPEKERVEPPYTRLDKVLRWTLLVTIIVSLIILAYGTIMVYNGQPPIPDQVQAHDGTVLATKHDINAGRDVFQRTDLMDFGSLYGNGSYFGPDWGTDYLHRQLDAMHNYDAQKQYHTSYNALNASERSSIDTLVKSHLRTNNYSNGTLTLTNDESAAYLAVRQYYRQLFMQGDKELGLPAGTVTSVSDADLLNAFFSWTSWTSVTPRPGQDFSYTNNWPYEPEAGNVPTTSTYTWSWASLISLGLLAVTIYYLYRWLFPTKKEEQEIEYVSPVEARAPTPSQYATGKWFVIVPVILFAQAMAGTLMAHYYADRSSWFSVEMLKLMPFNVTKAWHIQLAIFWIAAAWMGTGLFLAPIIGKKEPRFQRALVNILWVAVGAVVVLSSLGHLAGRQAAAARWSVGVGWQPGP